MVGLQQYSDTAIDTALGRLRRLEMSVASPLLLRLLSAKADGLISAGDVLGVLAALESFFIRRMVCRVPTNQLKRIFLGLTRELPQEYPVPFVVRYLANGVSGRRWPKDEEFRNEWLVYPAYSGSNDRCRLVLETLEADYAHKEPASFEAATIEHIMPQTLTDHWRNHLGDEAERVHEQFRDTIGNLALTAYNLSCPMRRSKRRSSSSQEPLRINQGHRRFINLERQQYTKSWTGSLCASLPNLVSTDR